MMKRFEGTVEVIVLKDILGFPKPLYRLPLFSGLSDYFKTDKDIRMNTDINTDRKKRIERRYIEEARRASQIFPPGELVPHEKPDFLLRADSGTTGLELTELCREKPRAEAGRLAEVPEKAKKRYMLLAAGEPLDVVAVFSPYSERVFSKDLINSLVDFVHQRRKSKGSSFIDPFELPDGYCFIGIHRPRKDPTGHWRGMQGSNATVAPEALLRATIAKKNSRLQDYRLTASAVWLLIVNDQFLGPGEVYAIPENLARWRFEFDFEKVLLFARKPGGGGTVFELKRI